MAKKIQPGLVLKVGDLWRGEGATAGWYREYGIGAVTQSSISGYVWIDGVAKPQYAGFKVHAEPVIPCQNDGVLRTDESKAAGLWKSPPGSPYCSSGCEADFYSKTSRRGKKAGSRLSGKEAREHQQRYWRLAQVYLPPEVS